MSIHTSEQYTPLPCPAASTTPIIGDNIGGFFATAAGVVTINGTNDQGAAIRIVAFTATANTWYELPFYIGSRGGTVVTDATAAGVLAK